MTIENSKRSFVMHRPVSRGSAFRSKVQQETNTKDIEQSLVNSGLLGKTPSRLEIRHAQPSLVEYKPPPDIYVPTPRSTRSRPKTATARAPPKTARNTAQPPKIQTTRSALQEPAAKEAPFVYYGRVLGSSEPPAANNFEQLNEILDRLIEDEATSTESIYSNIFGEVIRQYCVECAAQGHVLSDCRDRFCSAEEQIPVIQKHYDDIIDALNAEIGMNREAMVPIGPEIQRATVKRDHLAKVIGELRKDLGLLVDHHDSLIKLLATATNELMGLKANANQLENKIKKKNTKLLELIEQLRVLSSISASYTDDSLKFANNLAAIRRQNESTSASIKEARAVVTGHRTNIARIDKEITHLAETIERSRIKPVMVSFGTQIDLISRRVFKEKAANEASPGSEATSARAPEMRGSTWQRICKEFGLRSAKGTELKEITVASYDELAKLKQLIFEHETDFRMGNNVISAGHGGNFLLSHQDMDMTRLFAGALAQRILYNAIHKPGYASLGVQTLIPQQKVGITPTAYDRLIADSKLLRLVATDYSQRNAQQLTWLIQQIRTLYDEKARLDDKAIATGKELISFPEFIYNYAKSKFTLQFQCDQYCWDIYITSHEHDGRSQEVDLFLLFLDEKMTTEQLAFFLIGRGDCLKVGSAVALYTRDGLETYNEYFLSEDQMKMLMPLWWGQRLRQYHLDSILELCVNRPAIHLEAAKRYLAMHDILLKNAIFYAEDSILRLNELLLQSRITPRLTREQFARLMTTLIPSMKMEQLDEFYRSTVTKSKQRSNVSLKSFVDSFNRTSLLLNRKKIEAEENLNAELNDAVTKEWDLAKADFAKILEFFQSQSSLQPDNLTMKTYLDDAIRFHSNLLHSMSLNNGTLSSVQYYQFMFALDALFSTLSPMPNNQGTILSLECCVRETWLDTVF